VVLYLQVHLIMVCFILDVCDTALLAITQNVFCFDNHAFLIVWMSEY